MLTQELLHTLYAAGADLAGTAQMQAVENCPYTRRYAQWAEGGTV